MSWRVTHVGFGEARRRRQVILECCGRSAAEALAEAMFGPATYLAAICIGRAS